MVTCKLTNLEFSSFFLGNDPKQGKSHHIGRQRLLEEAMSFWQKSAAIPKRLLKL